ncbi:MAG: beta-lactamase family protein [Desulfobacteraceae bacterium]|nr:beta-lactamase family protein [Desulfobacteraceae bacterium]
MKTHIKKQFFLYFILIVLLSLSVNSSLIADETLHSADYWPTNGWRSSTPEEQGMDSGKLADMLEYINEKKLTIDSVTIIRNGYIVTDAYLNPLLKFDKKHIIHSCTKSIMSALIGIAIDKGYVKDIQQPVIGFFPDKKFANMDERKKAITIEHLLTMSHGIRTQDSFLYKWKGFMKMHKSNDWVKFILDQPMDAMPGERFDYSNMSSFLLSAIIHKQTKTSTLSFARKHLFEPLGITDIKWSKNLNGIHKGWGEMWLTPRDMAKIGWLYLNKGVWEDKQIVPKKWVEDSTKKIKFPKSFRKVYDEDGDLMIFKSIWARTLYNYFWEISDGYGYQWWIDDAGIYSTIGYGGQYIMVVPEKNMVVVFTSVLKKANFSKPGVILKDYIIPSVSSEKLISPDIAEQKRLKSLIKATDKNVKSVKVPSLPEMAQKISGQTYKYNANKHGYEKITLTFKPNKKTAMLKHVIRNYEHSLEIGLDNIYRVTYIRGNQIALKGHWSNNNTFVMLYNYIGNTIRGKSTITFKNNKLVLLNDDITQGKTERTGQVE